MAKISASQGILNSTKIPRVESRTLRVKLTNKGNSQIFGTSLRSHPKGQRNGGSDERNH